MLSFLFSRTGALVLGAAGAVLFLAATHHQAYRAGQQAERAAVLTRSVEILRERARTDDQIRNMDDASLCRALGGVFTDGSCQ